MEQLILEASVTTEDTKQLEDRVIYQLTNKGKLRAGEVYDLWKGDIVIVYKIYISDEPEIIITEDVLKVTFNGDMEKVRNLAKVNTPRMCPISFRGMYETLMEISDLVLAPSDEPEKMYVLRNTTGKHGATCILYPGIIELIRTKVEGNFWIMPSSIHEWIILVDDGFKKEAVKKIICDVNAREVTYSDYLSDDPLYCKGDEIICG